MHLGVLKRSAAIASLLAVAVLAGCSGGTPSAVVPGTGTAASSAVVRNPEDTSGGLPFSADMSDSTGGGTFGDARVVERSTGNDVIYLAGEVAGTMKYDGKPLVGATVELIGWKTKDRYAATTTNGGRFAFAAVGRDDYVVTVNGIVVPPQAIKIAYHRN